MSNTKLLTKNNLTIENYALLKKMLKGRENNRRVERVDYGINDLSTACLIFYLRKLYQTFIHKLEDIYSDAEEVE